MSTISEMHPLILNRLGSWLVLDRYPDDSPSGSFITDPSAIKKDGSKDI
jgi:hypothetical protein